VLRLTPCQLPDQLLSLVDAARPAAKVQCFQLQQQLLVEFEQSSKVSRGKPSKNRERIFYFIELMSIS